MFLFFNVGLLSMIHKLFFFRSNVFAEALPYKLCQRLQARKCDDSDILFKIFKNLRINKCGCNRYILKIGLTFLLIGKIRLTFLSKTELEVWGSS